jgi:hypothetical protein
MDGKKAGIYLGAAFMAAIAVWVSIAFMRAEGMTDMINWKTGAFVFAALVVADLSRRRIKKP